MSDAASLLTSIGSAVAGALAVAGVCAARDALRVLRGNTYVHFSRYFWPYVAVPLVLLTLLASVEAVGVGTIGHIVGVPPEWIGGLSAGVMMFTYAFSEARQSCTTNTKLTKNEKKDGDAGLTNSESGDRISASTAYEPRHSSKLAIVGRRTEEV